MKKILSFALACLVSISVFGQANWNPTTGSNFNWKYVLDATKSNQTPGTVFPVPPTRYPYITYTSATTSYFMPSPPSGRFKLSTNGTDATYRLLDFPGTTDVIEMHASSSGTVSKFSLYNIPEATALTTTFFTMHVEDNFATKGDFVMAIGCQSGSDTKLINGSGISNTTTQDTAVFACMKFSIATSDATRLTVNYTSPSGYVSLGNIFYRDIDYKFEILSNNTTSDQTYTRDGDVYTVPSGSYHVWYNGARLGTSVSETPSYDFPGNIVKRDKPLNALMIQANNSYSGASASNDASVLIYNIGMQFSMSTLPISLLGFTGNSTLGKVNLNWQTASETNNSYFDLLRFSADDLTPVKIATIQGKGNSNSVVKYSTSDDHPLSGVNFYQLRQVDFDGHSTLSKIISVNAGFNSDDFSVYQNNDNQIIANVRTSTTQNASFSLVSVQGHILNQFDKIITKGNNSIKLNTNQLPKGIYVATFNASGNRIAKKVIVQ